MDVKCQITTKSLVAAPEGLYEEAELVLVVLSSVLAIPWIPSQGLDECWQLPV
jgi:hypothetical protein